MTAQKGSAVLLKIGNGGTPTEIFSAIGGMRVTQMTVSHALLDASTRASGVWRQAVGNTGTRSVTVSGTGIFTDSTAEETLRAVAFAGSARNFQLAFGNGDVLQCAFLVTHYERIGAYDDAENFAVTLESTGDVVFA